MELQGKLLIAMPNLLDPNFYRSVILVLEHDEEGALGLILNRKSALTARELCINQGLIWRGNDAQVRVGGPVEVTSLWVLHDRGESVPDSAWIRDDCDLTTTLEGLTEVASAPGMNRLICAGYAGWGASQLAQEMRDGAWITIPAAPDLVFMQDVRNMWGEALRRVGIDPGALVSLGSGTLQ